MDVLITGATGLVGGKLARALIAAGHSVRVITRSPQDFEGAAPFAARAFGWDDLRRALEGADAVVNLAGESVFGGRWTAGKKRKIFESRVLGTRELVDAVAALGDRGPRVFINASAVGWYGDAGEAECLENAPAAQDFLATVCRDWEAELKRLPAGVRSVALRIGVVLDPAGGALRQMLPAARWGLAGPVGSGDQWMSWIHVDDLTRLVSFALETPQASGPINATAPAPVRNREFMQALAKALGRGPGPRAPGFALKLALGESAEVLLASQKVPPRRALELGFDFKHPEISSALVDLLKG